MNRSFVIRAAPIAIAVTVSACSGSSENPSIGSQSLTGQVELRAVNDETLVLPSTPQLPPDIAGLTQIVVTIARIDAKVDTENGREDDDHDTWVTVANGPITLDLLSLEGARFGTLGTAQLPVGDTDALRLIINDAGPNFVVTATGQRFPLVVPSGDHAGIRVVGDFDMQPCATGFLVVAFAGRHSIDVHFDGDHDAFVLRPILHVREVSVNGACAPTDDDGRDDRGHSRR